MLSLVSRIVLLLLYSLHILIVILPPLIWGYNRGVCTVRGRPVKDTSLLEYLCVERTSETFSKVFVHHPLNVNEVNIPNK